MSVEKKQLIGGVNTDDSERLLETYDYLNMENCRVGGSERGRAGRIENIRATKKLFTAPYTGITKSLASCTDSAKERLFYFNYNSNGNHAIYCYDRKAKKTYVLLKEADLVGGLGFSLAYPISCFFINDCLYWTDGLNEPRKINVERAIGAYDSTYVTDSIKVFYVLPLKPVNISWIRKPPIIPPSFTKQVKSNSNTNNGTGYVLTGQWLFVSFFSGGKVSPLIWFGYVLKVTSPIGDTYYGGPGQPPSPPPGVYFFDLYPRVGGSPVLPTSVDFATLPTATAFSSIAELTVYYAFNKIRDLTVQSGSTPPVTITNYPKPYDIAGNNFIRYSALQACWRYTYRDNEDSVLSKLSPLANYNYADDTFDVIKYELPFSEIIEQDVLYVDLVVRYVPEDKYFVIKTWENSISLDGPAIDQHNNQIAALTYYFDNGYTGKALDQVYAAKKFDLVPLKSKATCAGRNRNYLGNNVIGYDTPVSTSLKLSVATGSITNLLGTWYYILYNNGANKKYFVSTYDGIYTASTDPPPFPTTIDKSALTKVANGFPDLAAYLTGNPSYPNWTGGIQSAFQTSTLTGPAGTLPPVPKNSRALKSDASYKGAIHFIDFAGRECGVVSNEDLLVLTEDRDYAKDSYQSEIGWTLDQSRAAIEIPDMAVAYSVDLTLCLRTRFFLQMRNTKARYVSKDTDGVFTFTNTGYASQLLGCAFDISILTQRGFGYTYDGGSGDVLKIWLPDGKKFLLKITATVGNWLITELDNLGDLDDTTKYLFEIFTPHKRSESEPYFEQGQVYPVYNPGTPNKAYSVTAGTFKGDVYILSRTDGTESYVAECMSPNERFFSTWNTDAGKSATVDKIGQVKLRNGISFSNKIIFESRVNGLSSFDALDQDNTFEENGEIQRLVLASKQQEDGTVMLAICSIAPVSIYLGETQLISNAGDAFVAQAVGVIGTKNSLRGSNGTLHPTSVFEYLGNVYWYDVYNGVFVRYSNNGVFPVSSYKMNRFFERYSKKYLQDGVDVINVRNGFFNIVSGIDPFNGELLVSMPATEDDGFCGDLPGYDGLPSYTGSIDDRYDFYDGKAKTVAFKFKGDTNRWIGSYNFTADQMQYIGNQLYSWKDGSLYVHEGEETIFNKFHGVESPARFCFVTNANPSEIRTALTISVEGSAKPTFTQVMSKAPYIEATDLISGDYKKLEGVFYAAFMNDRLSPNVVGSPAKKMRKGDRIRTPTPHVMLEFAIYDKPINIDFVNVQYRESTGHKI